MIDVGLAVYFLARGEIAQAVEWSAKAAERRFPAFIPRLIRAFEPSLRRAGMAWRAEEDEPRMKRFSDSTYAGLDSMQQ